MAKYRKARAIFAIQSIVNLLSPVSNREICADDVGKTGERLSFRKISTKLAEAGYVNERGQPFNPKSVRAMLDRK